MMIRIAIAALLASVAAAVTAQAQLDGGPLALDNKETTRQFQQRTVNASVGLTLEGQTTAGSRSNLQLTIDHQLFGDLPEENARCGAINGIIAVGLPGGIEFAAEPRLYFEDPQTGEYKFMYSSTIDQKPWLPDISAALADASSSEPDRIYRGISSLNTVLDKRITTVLPSDTRLAGGDPNYSIAGKSWIVPCDVMFRDLTDIFAPEKSLLKQAKLRLTVPVKFTADYAGAEIVVYAGFLSTAVARVTLLPSEIPPGAIILVEQPEGQPAPPATTANGDATAEGEAGSPEDAGESAEEQDLPAEQADEEQQAAEGEQDAEQAPPPEGAADQAPPPPPEPVEALIYSFEWFSWETAANLAQAPSAAAPSVENILEAPDTTTPPAAAPGQPASEENAESQNGSSVDVGAQATAEQAAPSEAASAPALPVAHETGESTDVLVPGTTPVEQPPAAASPAATPPAGEVAETAPATPAPSAAASVEAGVVEIAPGTLPMEEQYYVVPLKPITGTRSAAGQAVVPPGLPGTVPGMPMQAPGLAAGQFVPPADLGEMVLIPEGYFLMGTGNTESAGDADELPQGQVYVPAFYIDKHLVTNRQFYAFVVSSGYKPLGSWDNYYDQGTADMPVRGVTWDDANAYARWAGKRLPTEAEWEKAARGTDGRLYPWGEEWSSEILPRGDYVFNLVHAQGALSPYGVQSMVGVLWQWTSSAYAPYPFNPDAVSEDKVLRGGCYSNGRNIIRCANRYAEPSNVALNTFGFRCARDA